MLNPFSVELATQLREHLQTWHDTVRLVNLEAFWTKEGPYDGFSDSLNLVGMRWSTRLTYRVRDGQAEVLVKFQDQEGCFPVTNEPSPKTIGDYVLHL